MAMGRPKGASNRSKQALIKLLQKQYPGYEPVLEMAGIALEKDDDDEFVYDVSIRSAMHKEVAAYCYPKYKSIEVNIEGEIKHSYYISGTPIKEIEGKVVKPTLESWQNQHNKLSTT